MKALVFSPDALFRVSGYRFEESWFNNFELPDALPRLKQIEINEVIYILPIDLDSDDEPIIVINQERPHPIFSQGGVNARTLERIGTVARRLYTPNVSIPSHWHPHYEGTTWSIFSSTTNDTSKGSRVHFETRPSGSQDLFVFAHTDEVIDFAKIPANEEIHLLARANLVEAILSPGPTTALNADHAGIILRERLPQGFSPNGGLEDWYSSLLTEEQRRFVDKSYDGPVRLRGSAGTGKTLALVLKFVRDGLQFEKEGIDTKLGLLTHNQASVDLVNEIANSFDPSGLIYGTGATCELEVMTLYEVAHKHLHFELDQLTPLSLDGREGRQLQFELIETVMKDMKASKISRSEFAELSPSMRRGWDAAAEGEGANFVREIMNEFANILDANGIRLGEISGEQYAKGKEYRPPWLLELPNVSDRRFVLEMHRRYREILGGMNTLSVDQMVADFNSFLDSNRWDRIRERLGYDGLFIDELHLFTSIERQTLHKLIKRKTDADGVVQRTPIFMAYDLKQSPRDTFTEYKEADNNLFAPRTGLQNSDLVKLSKVFRYTPEIAEFLEDLDASFPAVDIPGEWDAYAGEAQLERGNIPELTVFRDERSLFRTTFRQAGREARRRGEADRRGRVAVLCVSEQMFDTYMPLAEGQFGQRILPILNREAIPELRYLGKRFVFSMPEYVAGLQFETVFLIHVDSVEAPSDGPFGLRRRFISNIYLGSSRAEKNLRVSACTSRGGVSDVLSLALERGTLQRVVVD